VGLRLFVRGVRSLFQCRAHGPTTGLRCIKPSGHAGWHRNGRGWIWQTRKQLAGVTADAGEFHVPPVDA
jgi:hypothetical protein